MIDRTIKLDRLLILAIIAASFSVPGCRAIDRIKSWLNPSDEIELAAEPSPSTDPLVTQDTELGNAPDRTGLEVRMMVVDDTRYDAPRLLHDFESAGFGEIDEQTRATWSDWGFRMIEVPLDRLDGLLDSLTPIQPLSVQWMGEFGGWRPLVRAGAIPSTRVRVGESTYSVDAGRPRLIARSWIEPMLTSTDAVGALRLDLGMQIESPRQSGMRLVPDQRRARLEDDGMVIDELMSSLTLSGRNAIVIIGEAPGYDWSRLPEPARLVQPKNETGNDRVGPDAAEAEPETGASAGVDSLQSRRAIPPARSGGQIEPTAPAIRSLGELMLVGRGSRVVRPNKTRTLPKRVVVVLIPQAGGRFRLITSNATPIGGRP